MEEEQPMAVVIQFRRDTAAAFTAANPILAAGELGIELDTRFYKVGDGVTHWRDLLYGLLGPKGDKGDKGDDGADSYVAGPQGVAGFSLLNAAGEPSAGLGVNGDFCIDTVNHLVYGPKAGGSWGTGVSMIGPQGVQGIAGFTILNGSGAPASELGVNGDFYIDTTAHAIYGPKATGAWGTATTLVGPQGTQGVTGAAGFTVLNAAGAPAAEVGVNGDFCIDTTNHAVYGPKTGGAWGAGVSLIGPQGVQGATGVAGFTVGVNGDFYIDTTGNNIYGPKTTGAWGSATSLVGPQGAQGPGNLNYEGLWYTSTLYHVQDILKGADGFFYRSTTEHTSAASTEPGVGASWATVWDLFGGGGGGDFLVMQVFS
jgi:hypothetical protein